MWIHQVGGFLAAFNIPVVSAPTAVIVVVSIVTVIAFTAVGLIFVMIVMVVIVAVISTVITIIHEATGQEEWSEQQKSTHDSRKRFIHESAYPNGLARQAGM